MPKIYVSNASVMLGNFKSPARGICIILSNPVQERHEPDRKTLIFKNDQK